MIPLRKKRGIHPLGYSGIRLLPSTMANEMEASVPRDFPSPKEIFMSENPILVPKRDATFPHPSSFGRARSIRRIALRAGLILCLCAASVVCVAIITGSGHGFTAKIERLNAMDGVVLKRSLEEDGKQDGTRYLNVRGLENARPTDAKSVMSYLSAISEQGPLSGSHTHIDVYGYARSMVFSFYLENISLGLKEFTILIQLDSYEPPRNLDAANPYSYLRVGLLETEYPSMERRFIFYGAVNDFGQGTVEGGAYDLRECVSSYNLSDGLRQPIYRDESGGYCEPFEGETDLVRTRRTIKEGSTIGVSVVLYFEGYDPNCRGSHPEGSSIGLSAHFGV